MPPPPLSYSPGEGIVPAPSLFGGLLVEARHALLRQHFTETELPLEWALRHPVTGTSPELRSFAGAHPQRGTRWSAAHIIGPRVEILNLMIYPRDAARVPVFAVEYIAFGGRPRVAVVDLQPAAGTSAAPQLTAEIVAALKGVAMPLQSSLPGGGELPDWAVPHFTPVCIYTRPAYNDNCETLLADAFTDYFRIWCKVFLPRDDGRDASADELGSAHLAAYQRHHVEHTPGRPFLRKTYGEDWTERYLRDFMYRCESPTAMPVSVPSPEFSVPCP